jgi:hypothetical protein
LDPKNVQAKNNKHLAEEKLGKSNGVSNILSKLTND